MIDLTADKAARHDFIANEFIDKSNLDSEWNTNTTATNLKSKPGPETGLR